MFKRRTAMPKVEPVLMPPPHHDWGGEIDPALFEESDFAAGFEDLLKLAKAEDKIGGL